MDGRETPRYLMSGLLAAWDWFDNGLQNLVKEGGFRPLNKSQSMMVLYVSLGVTRPVDIARRMRLSRQAIRHISNQLVEMGILQTHDDPDDARSIRLSFTSKSNDMRAFADKAILDLEDLLRARIGQKDYEQLKRLIGLDWGLIAAKAKDLPAEARLSAARRLAI